MEREMTMEKENSMEINGSMETEYAIEVKNVTKKYKVFYDKGNQLKERLLFFKRNRYEERWVLKGIDFRVAKGEAIGLIGKNGCGKSTTLKLLTKIIYPDTGSIHMKGRVSSLIELGAGFHPDMTGRENIYTNASIFGLSRKEIEAKIDDIIAFSELQEYIDNPVRTYSSGMYMRLAFSVAINVNADILLIDEILAVGDANFQAKCFNKLREIKRKGTTIVIVSHSLGQIEQICEKSIWICDGEIRMEGSPRNVHPEYMEYMNEIRIELDETEKRRLEQREQELQQEKEQQAKVEAHKAWEEAQKAKEEAQMINANKKRYGNRHAHIHTVTLKNGKGEETSSFRMGQSMQIAYSYTVSEKVEDAVFGFGIFRSDGLWCYGTNTRIENFDNFDLEKEGGLVIDLEDLNLLQGEYWVDLAIEQGDGIPVDYYKEVCKFDVYSPVSDVGVCRIKHKWNIY